MTIIEEAKQIFSQLEQLEFTEKVKTLNQLRVELKKYSPFAHEPVDCVQWVPADAVMANDYNPNSVAPPEMKLLEHSILEDGYTQPIVTWRRDNIYEVVDGFHRNRVGKESQEVRNRIYNFLPLVVINHDRTDLGDRMASTIRHNRARGKHKVEAMSDIVIELKRRNWSDDKIAKNLGMDADEVLRLCQITGLAEAFKNEQFSEAWETNHITDTASEIISDIFTDIQCDDKGRIYHTWEKWECYRAGFYNEHPPKGMSVEEGEKNYCSFLSDLTQFESALNHIILNWKYSCEHYLTNDRMNRIAWLGQASVAYALQIPSICRGGFQLLTEEQKQNANLMALKYLNLWLAQNNKSTVTLKEAQGRTEAELY